MVIMQPDDNYVVREVEKVKNVQTVDELALSWRYRSGSIFMLVITNAFSDISLSEVIETIEENCGDDNKILSGSGNKIFARDNEDNFLKVYLMTEQSFRSKQRVWRIKEQELNVEMPYKISIYVCNHIEGENVIYVYDVDNGNEQNTYYIPMPLFCSMELKGKGLINRHYYVELRIRKPKWYIDGAIYYSVRGAGIIPLSERALGPLLYIELMDEIKPIVGVFDEMSKYYRIVMK